MRTNRLLGFALAFTLSGSVCFTPAMATVGDTAMAVAEPSSITDAPENPSAVTVLTETSGGGLLAHQVETDRPELTAAALERLPNVVAASSIKSRAILAISQPGAARDLQWPLNQLHAEDAWKVSTGRGVVVAVLDSGVDGGHHDLAGHLVPGFDFIRGLSSTAATDLNGHGTHVAGLITARGIVTGLAPNAKVMPVKVMDSQGFGTSFDVVNGIIWAVNHGAQILNMSLGSPEPDEAERSALKWARGRGVIIVAAAGNDGTNAPTYPAAYGDDADDSTATADPVVGVGSTNNSGQRSFFSQLGNSVDVVAPGERILSTFTREKREYSWESGTSMAVPYVSSVAALGISYAHGAHPDWTAKHLGDAVLGALRASAFDLGPAGTDSRNGQGSVDAVATLRALGAPAWSGMSADLSLAPRGHGSALLKFTAPAGSKVRAVLTEAAGSGGAPTAGGPQGGKLVYAGVAGARTVQRVLAGLSPRNSYAIILSTTSLGRSAETIIGVRPLEWKMTHPRRLHRHRKNMLKVSTSLPGLGPVPAGRVLIRFTWKGHRASVQERPMSSGTVRLPIPFVKKRIRIRAWVTNGVGTWPATTGVRVLSGTN